jgi:hypothetical protein
MAWLLLLTEQVIPSDYPPIWIFIDVDHGAVWPASFDSSLSIGRNGFAIPSA